MQRHGEMTLIAKPVIKNQLWVVTDGKQKVGNVVADQSGYELKLGDVTTHFASTRSIEKDVKITFAPAQKTKSVQETPSFAVWPTERPRVYNSVYDVKRKLHLYTTTPKSKCYHAAGWFAIKQHKEWEKVFCPKYIYLQRYDYVGPVSSENELNI